MFSKKIRQVLLDKEIKLGAYAARLNSSHPNLSQKLKRDNFCEKEMQQMCELLDCDLEIIIRDRKTNKEY